MKYYLVNYIILKNRTITENTSMGISLPTFANNEEFKKWIAARKQPGLEPNNIVIKSYEQISEEAFNSLCIPS